MVLGAGWLYVTSLRSQITSLKEDVRVLSEAIQICDDQKSKCQASVSIYENNLRELDRYYRGRGQLKLDDKPLTEDDLKLK